jgi:tetratricopeptide (TPR) repeat protein
MRYLGLFIFFTLLYSCSTSSRVSIKTFPESADVAMIDRNGEVRTVGKTPLTVPPDYLSSGRVSSFLVTKEGYKDHQVVLGRDRSSESYDITINLQVEAEDLKSKDSIERQEKLSKLLLEGHNLTNAKRFTEAERVLTGLTLDYPSISAGYDLLGNVYYLQKDLKNALKNYERSLELNPENLKTRLMVEKLKGMLQ